MRVIKSIPYPTAKEKIKYIETAGIQVSPTKYQVSLNFDRYNNMYDLLYDKIKDSRTFINESGKMYTNFEEAIKYYRNFKSSYRVTLAAFNAASAASIAVTSPPPNVFLAN